MPNALETLLKSIPAIPSAYSNKFDHANSLAKTSAAAELMS